jgi:hypothetical protein
MTTLPGDRKSGNPTSNVNECESKTAPKELHQFLKAIFSPEDLVLLRPIEIWEENGQKKNRVIFKKIRYSKPSTILKSPAWKSLLEIGQKEKANLFFGVCPRFGGKGQFDLAWQIRTVRTLWVDIDHCAPEEALQRCAAAGLPHPSVVVQSGSGVHLYWILSEPYLIDDVGNPAPVFKEFLEQEEGKKKKVRYYLVDPQTQKKIFKLPKVSPKGKQIQRIIAGISAKIGGDSTQDLSRLLRLPGTLNRKDERNGRAPIPCRLIECYPERKYPLSDFDKFAEEEKPKETAEVRLPRSVKLTQTRMNKLADFMNLCSVSEDRSRADWSLCCWAIETGIDKEAVWLEVQGVGKFEERGRDYFDQTWDKAEDHVRSKVYRHICSKAGIQARVSGTDPHQNGNGHRPSGNDSHSGIEPPDIEGPDESSLFTNHHLICAAEGEKQVAQGYSIQYLHRSLEQFVGDWPKRVGSLLFAEGNNHKPLWLYKPPETFAWIANQLPNQNDNHLSWADGKNMVSQAQFHSYLTQSAPCYDAVEPYPHCPVLPGHYYMHPEPEGGSGEALAELLHRFNPASLVDYDLIAAFYLSLVWGGLPGTRPAWLFTSDDEDDGSGRGVGKSKAAQMGARLVGGAITVSPDEPMDKLMPRLLSPDGLSRRIALLDNVKRVRFSWAELESLITTDTISGRQLYVGEGRRPNTLTWAITLNGANLSKDMSQRCVIVKVSRPEEYSATWEEETAALIETKRWEIVGDLLAILKQPTMPLKRHSRWGAWEDAVLAHVGDPSECQKVIEERQGQVDDDSAEADLIREYFAEQIRRRGFNQATQVIWIPTALAAEWMEDATGEKRPVNRASSLLATLNIKELRKGSEHGRRGWRWTGLKSPGGLAAIEIGS